jgi:thiamine-phosphate pyrophosphorylase
MTDERVPRNALLRAIRRLPAGGGVVLRHYSWSDDERRTLLDEVRAATRGRRICLALAGTEKLAGKWGADGWHGTPSRRERRAVGRDHALIRTAAVHNMAQLRDAGRAQVDLIFVSPLFRTRSHPGAVPLGSVRFAAIARQVRRR